MPDPKSPHEKDSYLDEQLGHESDRVRITLSLPTIARVCRYAVALQILDRASMEHWATAALDEPDSPFVLADIATSSRLDSSALAALLEEVPGPRDDARAAKALLGAIAVALHAGRIGIRRACGVASELACAAPLDDELKYEVDAFDDRIALGDGGTWDDENVERDVRAFFAGWTDEAVGLPIVLSFE